MDILNLLDIFTAAGEKIDALWEFFVTVHMGVFAAFFYLHKIKKYQVSLFFVSYIAFSLINLRAKLEEYSFFAAIILDTKKIIVDTNFTNLINFFSMYDISDRQFIAITVHLFSFLGVSFLSYMAWISGRKN